MGQGMLVATGGSPWSDAAVARDEKNSERIVEEQDCIFAVRCKAARGLSASLPRR